LEKRQSIRSALEAESVNRHIAANLRMEISHTGVE